MEVWNAQWDEQDQQAVQKWQELLVDGKFLTAIGGSDSHSPPSLNGWPTTIVKARGRSQAAIVEGVKAGRAYLVQGPGMDLTFEVRVPSLDAPAQIGDKVRRTAAGAKAVLVTDGMSKLKACFVSDKGYFYNTTIEDGVRVKTGVLSGARFVRVEVRNGTTDEVLALTNPVWFLGP